MMHRLNIGILLLLSLLIWSKTEGQVVCPIQGDTVVSGELLIVYRFADSLQIKPASVKVTIDLKKYNIGLKVNGSKVSLLVLEPISSGYKIVRIEAKDKNARLLHKEWGFYVTRKVANNAGVHSQHEIPQKKRQQFRGNVETLSKLAAVSGPGSAQRQEPPATQVLRLNVNYKNATLEVPLKVYLTNYEDRTLQARNRFLTGIKTKTAGLLLGDVHPSYHPLILNGTRVRGGSIYLRLQWLQFDVAYGRLKRSVEGALKYYNSLQNPDYAPVNLQIIPNNNDTAIMIQGYYNDVGTYSRNMMAARLSLGSQKRRSWFRITATRATDDTTSVSYGGQAAQNFVFGFSFDHKSKNRKFTLDMGVSSALTTRDIRNGIATKEDFFTLYHRHIPFEPYTYRKIIVINTTTDLTTKHTPFLSWYFHPQMKIANQNISFEARRIGSNYYAFGNPYLINDRLNFLVSDRMRFLKNRLFINLYFRSFKDNLSGVNDFTHVNTIYNGSFNLLINKNLPRFIGGFHSFYRTSVPTTDSLTGSNNQVTSFNFGINHHFIIFSGNSVVFFTYTNSSRRSPTLTSPLTTHLLNLNLSQTYPFGLTINIYYNFLLLTNETSDYNKNNTYLFRVGYKTRNKKFGFSAGARRIYFAQTLFFPESARSSIDLTVDYKPFRHFQISLKLGQSMYEDKTSSDNNYNELWGLLQLKYRFFSISK